MWERRDGTRFFNVPTRDPVIWCFEDSTVYKFSRVKVSRYVDQYLGWFQDRSVCNKDSTDVLWHAPLGGIKV